MCATRGRGTRPRRCSRRGHARTRRNSWRDTQATGRVRAAPPRLALYRLRRQHPQGPVDRLAGDRLAVAEELADLLDRPPGCAEVPGGLHLPGRQPVLAARRSGRGANLSQADLRGASLSDAILEDTVLTGAQADTSTIWPTDFNAQTRRELGIIERSAITTWPRRTAYPGDFRQLMLNGMRQDHSWTQPGQHYANIYDHIRHEDPRACQAEEPEQWASLLSILTAFPTSAARSSASRRRSGPGALILFSCHRGPPGSPTWTVLTRSPCTCTSRSSRRRRGPRTAPIISNLQHMMDNPGIGDNHNAPVFLGATNAWASSSPSCSRGASAARHARVLRHAAARPAPDGLHDVFDALAGHHLRPTQPAGVEWLGCPWGHAVAPSTPVQDYRLHVRAWQHHFAAIFGLEALAASAASPPRKWRCPTTPMWPTSSSRP